VKLEGNPLARNETPLHRKLIQPGPGGGEKVYVDFRPRTFRLLEDTDLLDTADLCRLFGCSARTVYRWMAEHTLRPHRKVGREFLFTKREILRWHDANRPHPGRPPLRRRSP
jgi:excisionase family DNA binding protein